MRVVTTGMSGLDKILSGGIEGNKCILVKGAPGTGKTTFGIQFLVKNKIRNPGLKTLYLAFEEDLQQLKDNFSSFELDSEKKWNLDSININPLRFDKRIYDKREILAELTNILDKKKIDLLVVDSINYLTEYVSVEGYRELLSDLIGILRIRHIASLLIGEEAEYLGDGISEYLVDGIIRLSLEDNKRYLEIVKMRGQNYIEGKHSYKICDADAAVRESEGYYEDGKEVPYTCGINVFPNITYYARLSETVLREESGEEYISTGTKGLDEMLSGEYEREKGFMRRDTILIAGNPGSGKTILGLQFFKKGREEWEENNKKDGALWISFEGEKERLEKSIATLNESLGFKKLIHNRDIDGDKYFYFKYFTPVELNFDEFIHIIDYHIRNYEIKRLCIDSISDLAAQFDDSIQFKSAISPLCQYLNIKKVTTLLLYRIPESFGSVESLGIEITSMVDIILVMKNIEIHNKIEKGIFVLKIRGRKHHSKIRTVMINFEKGLMVKDLSWSLESLISGETCEIIKSTVGRDLLSKEHILLWAPLEKMPVLDDEVRKLGFKDKFFRLIEVDEITWSKVLSFSKSWLSAKEKFHTEKFEEEINKITSHLCDIFGFKIIFKKAYDHLYGLMVKAPTLQLKIPLQFPIIYIGKEQFTEKDVNSLRDLMGVLGAEGYFGFIVVFRNSEEIRKLVKGSEYDFIVLDEQQLKEILFTEDKKKRLIEIILSQVDLTVVSPYVWAGPVPENMFFGREQEVKTITRTIKSNNFALIGGRRIGKTSLLNKVNRLFSEKKEFYTIYLNCEYIGDYKGFFKAIGEKIEVKISTFSPSEFKGIVVNLKKEKKKEVVFILDEVDRLLIYDKDNYEDLFRVFRALSQEGYCRFIFSGDIILNSRLKSAKSPLFNFCKVLKLGFLEEAATERMVIEPMEDLQVEFQDKERIVKGIIGITSCHPNLVQYTCDSLINRISKRETKKILTDDVDMVIQSQEFNEYLTTLFWEKPSYIEKILILSMLNYSSFGIFQIKREFEKQGIAIKFSGVQQALENLCLYSVLVRKNKDYGFAIKSFPERMRKIQDIPVLLNSLLEEGEV